MTRHAALRESAGERSDRPGIVVVTAGRVWKISCKDTTRMFSQLGYAAVAPTLYHRDGPDCNDDNEVRKARLRDPSIIRDIEGAIRISQKSPAGRRRPGSASSVLHGRAVGLFDVGGEHRLEGRRVMFYGSSTMEPYGEALGRRPSTARAKSIVRSKATSRRRSKSLARRHAQARCRAEQVRQAPRIHSYAGAAHAFVNSGSTNYRPHADAAILAQGDGVFCPAFGWIEGAGVLLTVPIVQIESVGASIVAAPPLGHSF